MIFLTVGTQLPFDRLIRAVDEWAGRAGADVFAQIGPGAYVPRHMRWSRFLRADECGEHVRQADMVVAHAGMGSILTALQSGKPILVLPRRGDLGEHRNDHQLATARQFRAQGRIRVAFDELELTRQLARWQTLEAGDRITPMAAPSLIAALREFAGALNAPSRGLARAATPVPFCTGQQLASSAFDAASASS